MRVQETHIGMDIDIRIDDYRIVTSAATLVGNVAARLPDAKMQAHRDLARRTLRRSSAVERAL